MTDDLPRGIAQAVDTASEATGDPVLDHDLPSADDGLADKRSPTFAEEILGDLTPRAQQTFTYLNQGKFWLPDGRPAVPIETMDLTWRYNASRWLERHARAFANWYDMGEALWLYAPSLREVVGERDGEPVEAGPRFSPFDTMGERTQDGFEDASLHRLTDPATWIRSTTLYRALVADLPGGRKKLKRLAERARHWSTCPKRTNLADDCKCSADDCRLPDCGCDGRRHDG